MKGFLVQDMVKFDQNQQKRVVNKNVQRPVSARGNKKCVTRTRTIWVNFVSVR